jgi:hypothetical protein
VQAGSSQARSKQHGKAGTHEQQEQQFGDVSTARLALDALLQVEASNESAMVYALADAQEQHEAEHSKTQQVRRMHLCLPEKGRIMIPSSQVSTHAGSQAVIHILLAACNATHHVCTFSSYASTSLHRLDKDSIILHLSPSKHAGLPCPSPVHLPLHATRNWKPLHHSWGSCAASTLRSRPSTRRA